MCELLLLVVKNKVDKTEMDTPTTTETEKPWEHGAVKGRKTASTVISRV